MQMAGIDRAFSAIEGTAESSSHDASCIPWYKAFVVDQRPPDVHGVVAVTVRVDGSSDGDLSWIIEGRSPCVLLLHGGALVTVEKESVGVSGPGTFRVGIVADAPREHNADGCIWFTLPELVPDARFFLKSVPTREPWWLQQRQQQQQEDQAGAKRRRRRHRGHNDQNEYATDSWNAPEDAHGIEMKQAALPPYQTPFGMPMGAISQGNSNGSRLVQLLAVLVVAGIWVAFMFMHIAIFTGIGKTSNWLTCLAYVFLGLPAACFVFSAATQVIWNLSESRRLNECTSSPVIGIMAMITWFAIGIPLTMVTAQEHALVRYLDPQFQQDWDCYREVQPTYKHGSVHMIFLKDREWEVDSTFTSAKLPYEGNHYFYASLLRYRGKATFNCPTPIMLACYHQGSPVKSFDYIKKKCWSQPPTGVSIRVMNQNEQFFRNWIDENDTEAEKFIRKSLVPKVPGATTAMPLVTFNGDHPADFLEKLDKVRKARRICLIFTWTWWSFMIFVYFLAVACSR